MWEPVIGLLMLLAGGFVSTDADAKAHQCAEDLYRGMLLRRGYVTDTKLAEVLSEAVVVERQDRQKWSVLHGEVFLASYTFQRPVVEAWVIADGETCAVLGGDLETILGMRLDRRGQVAYAVKEYNDYVKTTGRPPVLSTSEHLASYATAVLHLLIPSHHYLVVENVDDVPLQDAEDEPARQSTRNCLQKARPMEVEARTTGHAVSFFAWEEIGGVLTSNTVLVSPNAEVAVTHEVVCERIGRYRVRGRL